MGREKKVFHFGAPQEERKLKAQSGWRGRIFQRED
jgi:hypothetical protein